MLNAEFINAYSVYPIEQVLSSRLSTFVKTTFLSPVAPFAIYFYSANLLITPLTFLLNFLYDFLLLIAYQPGYIHSLPSLNVSIVNICFGKVSAMAWYDPATI